VRPGRPERGSAAVEFLLVSVLVLALLLGVVQVALADRGPADGVARTRALLAQALTGDYARDVTAGRTTIDGAPVTEVTVRTPLPVVGLLGPGGTLTVRGHALEEAP
jgi:hypothetical protein